MRLWSVPETQLLAGERWKKKTKPNTTKIEMKPAQWFLVNMISSLSLAVISAKRVTEYLKL